MGRLVRALGGDPAAAAGLPGAGDLDVTTNGGRTGRFGRLLGLGRTRDAAIAEMEGATLECLEILAVLRAAVPSLVAGGTLPEGALPLALHLADVALDGAPVDFPLARFFEGTA
jgi:glycerol-3-phosphate dehydrogenase (NAD(P)+)